MKVKLTYTANLKEVPDLVDPLLDSAKESTEMACKIMQSLKETKALSVERCISAIEEIRSLLYDVDLAMGDSHGMLSGYMRATYEAHEVSEAEGEHE